MAFCLPKEFAEKMIIALKEGRVVPEKLVKMSSEQRRSFLEDIVGRENVREVNAQLEAKLILKDQKRGLVTWAKNITGIKESVRRDLLSKIERLDKVLESKTEQAFLEDLVAKKLKTEVTLEEAKAITEGAIELRAKKNAIPQEYIDANTPAEIKAWRERNPEILEYGVAEVLFRDFIEALQSKDPRTKTQVFKDWITNPKKIIFQVAGITKSLLASLDNSFFGRQGIKILFTQPTIWAKNFIKSFGDIGKELRGISAMTPIKADVFSRPNALNGKYEAGKYDLGIKFEEAFPVSVPGQVPIFGRVFRAAESAFTGAAMRIRADYGDLLIRNAERQGIDVLNPVEAVPIGKLVNYMTGRGDIGKLKVIGGELNAAVFSIRFLKANIDFLLEGLKGAFDVASPFKKSTFARREAAKNLAKVVASTSAILFTAEQLWPGSVELDPRSANFGKIRIGDTRFDVTGGMASIINLVSRVTPTLHDGEWGFWFRSSITGKFTRLNSGKFGSRTAMDIINNFWLGKLSPIAGAFRDVARGRNFQGDKPTVGNVTTSLIKPIPIQTFEELKSNPESADLLLSMILEGLGISANTYSR